MGSILASTPPAATKAANQPQDTDLEASSTYTVAEHLHRLALRAATGRLEATCPTGTVRAHVCEGQVAWVHCSTYGRFLSNLLAEELCLSVSELQAVVSRCRVSKRRFGEQLVEDGVVEPGRLAALLGQHNAQHLRHAAALGDVAATFTPSCAHYQPEFLLPHTELLAQADRLHEIAMTQAAQKVANLVSESPAKCEVTVFINYALATVLMRHGEPLCAEAQQSLAIAFSLGTAPAKSIYATAFETAFAATRLRCGTVIIIRGPAKAGSRLSTLLRRICETP